MAIQGLHTQNIKRKRTRRPSEVTASSIESNQSRSESGLAAGIDAAAMETSAH